MERSTLTNDTWLHKSHLTGEVLLVIGILVILGIGIWAYLFTHPRTIGLGSSMMPNAYELFISSEAAPFQPVISIGSSDSIPKIYTVTGQGTATLVGVAMSGTSTPYYLISDPELQTSNLYEGSVKNPNAGLSQLTNSSTFKYDLSYDPASGIAAYVVLSHASSSPHVMVYTPLTKKETDLGAGTDPTVLPGGGIVIDRQGNTLVSISTDNGKTYSLLNISSTAPFALDTQKGMLALYDPDTHSIQYFSVSSKVSASYASSTKTTIAPAALVFVNHSLLMSYTSFGVTAKNAQPEIILQYVGATTKDPIIFSSKVPLPIGPYTLTAQT